MKRTGKWLSLALLITGLTLARLSSAATTYVAEDRTFIRYEGDWQRYEVAGVRDRSIKASKQPGASVTVYFIGTAITWIGNRCPCGGRALVYLDGQAIPEQYIDAYATTRQPQVVLYRISELADVEHVLKIEVSAVTNPAATAGYIGVDGFVIEGDMWDFEAGADGEVFFTYPWERIINASADRGSIMASNVPAANALVDFTGTGVEWIGARCPCGGGARIYLDEELVDTVDTYAPSLEWQQTIYAIDGLPEGQHRLRVEVTGVANSAGTGAYVGVDTFRVTLPEAGPVIDSERPTIVITTPAGRTVYGDRAEPPIFAEAEDNVGIEGVRFYVDDVPVGSEDTQAPYGSNWNTLDFSDGTHMMTAIARDAAGNETRSAPVSVIVDNAADRTAPTTRITSHEPFDLVTGMVTITADATDNVGVTRVQFFAKRYPNTYTDILLGEDTTPPYSITRDTSDIPSDTHHSVRAVAYDAAGNYSEGGYVVITVQHIDRVRPTVALSQPVEGALVSGTITLTAEATDERGVARVGFWRPGHYGLVQIANATTAPYTATLDTTRLPDGTNELYVEAQDTAGNFSMPGGTKHGRVNFIVDNSVVPGRVRVDDTNPAAVYSGEWVQYGDASTPGGYYHWDHGTGSAVTGAHVRFTFTGTGVRWLGPKCYECGSADVSIDGGPATLVILRQGSDLDGSLGGPLQGSGSVYESPALPYGTHTLDLTVREKMSVIAGQLIIVDAFEILNP